MSSNKLLYKYQGAGNDFVLIEEASSFTFQPSVIKKLCDRHHGLGADGVLQLEKLKDDSSLWRMRIYNADGSLATMCGNGLRAVAAHVWKKEASSHRFSIQSDGGIHEILPAIPLQAQTSSSLYFAKTCFGKVQAIEKSPHLTLDLQASKAWLQEKSVKATYFLDSGVPHLFFLTDKDEADLYSLGKYWRYHPRFSPEGTNVSVGFFQNETLHLRTYERGVENITHACGTGAVAAAVALLDFLKDNTRSSVQVQFPQEPIMKVEQDSNGLSWLTGPAAFVFQTQDYDSALLN